MTNALANEIERIDELVKWATRPDRLIKNNTQLADRMKIAWPLFKAALRSAEEVGRLRDRALNQAIHIANMFAKEDAPERSQVTAHAIALAIKALRDGNKSVVDSVLDQTVMVDALTDALEYFEQREDISMKNERVGNEEMQLARTIRAALAPKETR